MRGPKKERWMHLCELIADEQDRERFAQLTKQLLAELEAKDKQLKSAAKESSSNQSASSE